MPYAGSGSELIVIKKLRRSFISSEIDCDFCELIEKKLDVSILTFDAEEENEK